MWEILRLIVYVHISIDVWEFIFSVWIFLLSCTICRFVCCLQLHPVWSYPSIIFFSLKFCLCLSRNGVKFILGWFCQNCMHCHIINLQNHAHKLYMLLHGSGCRGVLSGKWYMSKVLKLEAALIFFLCRKRSLREMLLLQSCSDLKFWSLKFKHIESSQLNMWV